MYSILFKRIMQLLALLVGRKEEHPTCKKRWRAGVVICLGRGADLHMAQLMPLPVTVSCFSKIQIGFTFLVLAHLGSPRQRAIERVLYVASESILLSQILIHSAASWNIIHCEETYSVIIMCCRNVCVSQSIIED